MRAMGRARQKGLMSLEGLRVSVALTDGSRIDDAELASAGGPGATCLRLFVDGIDVFVPSDLVVACWEVTPARRRPPVRAA